MKRAHSITSMLRWTKVHALAIIAAADSG